MFQGPLEAGASATVVLQQGVCDQLHQARERENFVVATATLPVEQVLQEFRIGDLLPQQQH